MAKFDLKKAILENKATFFGSLTEGQFSWMTQDTGQQIGSQDENMIPVYMFDDKGKYYYENDYEGYGVFGGKDYYDLVAEMNGYTVEDAEELGGMFKNLRGVGVKLAFGELEPKNGGPVLFPALVTKPDKFNYKSHDFTQEAETDPNQSWYTPEEEDYYDQNDEDEDYNRYGDEDEEELDEIKETKPTTKMKKSELKAKIKEMIVAEIALDIDNMEDAPESEVDFLAELEDMLDEADETEKDTAEAEDVTIDDTETIDTETTTEVDPNVKAVQDALTQAQAAAQKLGDPKLTDQIGNTITFFTRAHVVEKGAVAEGKLEEFQKPEEDSNIEVLKKRYQFVPLEDLETIASKQDFKVWTIGSPDFDANAVQLGDYIKFPMDSEPALVFQADEQSVNAAYDNAEYSKYNRSLLKKMNREASTGIKEDKKPSMNESMFPMLKKILK